MIGNVDARQDRPGGKSPGPSVFHLIVLQRTHCGIADLLASYSGIDQRALEARRSACRSGNRGGGPQGEPGTARRLADIRARL